MTEDVLLESGDGTPLCWSLRELQAPSLSRSITLQVR